jgi:N-methylhydantoinase B
MVAGDVLEIRTAGSGGYGDPRERPRGAVVQDVLDGYVSPASAATDYGLDGALSPPARRER